MDKALKYRYNKIELSQFAIFEDNYNSNINGVQFETDTRFSYDRKQAMVCCTITTQMTQENQLLLKIELKSYFTIHPDSLQEIKNADGNIEFESPILIQFASLCYGTERGVIFSKTLGTNLNDFVLPPVYFDPIINSNFIVEL